MTGQARHAACIPVFLSFLVMAHLYAFLLSYLPEWLPFMPAASRIVPSDLSSSCQTMGLQCCLSVCLSVCLPSCLSSYLVGCHNAGNPICLPAFQHFWLLVHVYLPTFFAVYESDALSASSVYLHVCLPGWVRLSNRLSVCVSVYWYVEWLPLPACMSVCLCACLYVCLLGDCLLKTITWRQLQKFNRC